MPISSFQLIKKGYLLSAIRTSTIYAFLRSNKKRGLDVNVGYHSYHLYGLAMLKENFPDHKIWKSKKIKKAIKYTLSDEYKEQVMNSKYGIGYNPPGFEVAFSLSVFRGLIEEKKDLERKILWWIEEQIRRTYNFNEKMMNMVETDPITYSARLYEATRINVNILKTKLSL